MPVTKNCPSCNCEVNVRKVVCPSCDRLRKHKPEEAKRRTLRRACPVRRLARERAAKKRALETAGTG